MVEGGCYVRVGITSRRVERAEGKRRKFVSDVRIEAIKDLLVFVARSCYPELTEYVRDLRCRCCGVSYISDASESLKKGCVLRLPRFAPPCRSCGLFPWVVIPERLSEEMSRLFSDAGKLYEMLWKDAF